MHVQNVTNAFVILSEAGTRVVIDPWIIDGAYDGSWIIHPQLHDPSQYMRDLDAVIVTHVHEDHFDVEALRLLNSRTKIFFPDVWANRQIAGKKLPERLRESAQFIPLSQEFHVVGFTFEFIPPMNKAGHLSESQDDNEVLFAIDAGVWVKDSCVTISVFLADNFPFCLDSAGTSLEKMKGCDLLAFSYNAMADDYPVCYDNLSVEEKHQACLKCHQIRDKAITSMFRRLVPKRGLVYSSDFMIAGSRALEFIQTCPYRYRQKDAAAECFSTNTGIPCEYLYADDDMFITPDRFDTTRKTIVETSMGERVTSLLQIKNSHTFPVCSAQDFYETFKQAANNMCVRLEKMGLSSEWMLELVPNNPEFSSVFVDLRSSLFGVLKTRPKVSTHHPLSKRLVCRADVEYFYALLTYKEHWDNAIMGYKLSWERYPDEYDLGLYKSLNFLHVPFRGS